VSGTFSLLKQIRVRAGAGEKHFFVGDVVDQEPVGFNVTFPQAFVLAGELVGSRSRRQWGVVSKPICNRKQVVTVFAAPKHPFEVALESVSKYYIAHARGSARMSRILRRPLVYQDFSAVVHLVLRVASLHSGYGSEMDNLQAPIFGRAQTVLPWRSQQL